MSGKSFFTLQNAFIFVTCIVITVYIVENQNHAKADLEDSYNDTSAAQQKELPPKTRMQTRTVLAEDSEADTEETDADTDGNEKNAARTENVETVTQESAGLNADGNSDTVRTVSFPHAELVPGNSENERIETALLMKATCIEECRITHYCTCKICCGWGLGITASGLPATAYTTVAVDPKLIPLGSDVIIDFHDGTGLQYYKADDTGSAVNGTHIDICVSEHQEALQLGVKYATVYFIPPEQF